MSDTGGKNAETDIGTILAGLIPALGPYGPVIALAIQVIEKVAPAVYEEIAALIAQVQSGGAVSEDDIVRLESIIAALKEPDDYFK